MANSNKKAANKAAAKAVLKQAQVSGPVAKAIIKRAQSTGGGVSASELAQIQKKAATLKGKTLSQVDPKKFLGTLKDRRKLLNKNTNSDNNIGNFGSQIDYLTFGDGYSSPDTIVRTPTRDVVEYSDNDDIPVELISNLLFENLAANELIKYERHDTIEGTNVSYDIISNLSSIRKQFDPSTLISRQKPDTSYFDIYNIKLEDKIPGKRYLIENSIENFYYIDTNGDLVIELDNMNPDELIEVQIDSGGTIYKVQL
jgi:hypothetical protein